MTSTEETKHTQFPSALAANPRDANQLLIAYEAANAVFLWDFAKRKVVREFTFAKKKAAPLTRTSTSSGTSISSSFGTNTSLDTQDTVECNSPQTISWHSSGKRFAAGYKFGGFAVFRADKSQGHYHSVLVSEPVPTSDTVDPDTSDTLVSSSAIRQLQWVCAPPTSKNAHVAGAILYSGGCGSAHNALTLVYPPRDVASEDTLSEFAKAEHLTWRVATIPTVNNAEIANFAVACDQVDYCAKIAPLSVILLSGNPLDGCLPSVSVQPLPCFVRFKENDKEDWEWCLDQLPRACAIPPLLQFSSLSTFAIVSLLHSDGALQDDLYTTWEQEKHDPLFQLLASEDFEWPLNGGSVVEPLLSRFLTGSSSAFKDEMQTICQNGTLLLTGHANGFVLFWELIAPAERASKGTLHLLHVIDVPLQMAPIPTTKAISCLSFCHDARVLVVGFSTGEIAVLEFGQWKQRRPSSLLESHFSSVSENVIPGAGTTGTEAATDTGTNDDTEEEKPADIGSSDASQLAGASLKDVTGFKTLFTLHIHNQAIQSLSLSTAYGYFAASDAGGVVSLTQIASQSYKLLIFELSTSTAVDEDPVSVESLLMSELVQATDIPAPMSSSFGSGGGISSKLSKGSPTRLRRLSLSSTGAGGGAGIDGSFVTQHREVIPVLFVGRGNGKLEMFHVQTGTKVAESLVDRRKASSLSSIIMVDADGKRINIPGRVWVEQGDGIASPEDVVTEVMASVPVGISESPGEANTCAPETASGDNSERDGDGMSATARHVRSPSTELEYTKRIVLGVINEQSMASSGDVVLVQNEERLANATITSASTKTGARSNVIEVTVAAGSSLGLHLFTDIEQHAVVKGFVLESPTAFMIESRGVHAGHVIMSINGLDLTSYGRHVICGVLEKLRDREKVIVFAEGFNYTNAPLPEDVSKDIGVFNDLLGDGANHTDVERPRFLVCTCGKAIHLLQAVIPKASEMASGLREMLAQPLASVELRAAVVTTSVIRVPVAERVENCLVAIDQSNHLYVLSLLSLEVIWEKECFSLGNSFDSIRCEVSYSGELVVANSFGEVERFSFFAEQTAIENALLERKCIKTRLHLQEREFISEKEKEKQHQLVTGASPPKKKSLADKMFKKLVTGLKGDVDLNKVFQFNREESEREQLLGDRAAQAKASSAAAGKTADDDGSKKVGKGLGDTKDALMQATQV